MIYWKIIEAGDFKKYSRDLLLYYTKNIKKFSCTNTFWYQFQPQYYKQYFLDNPSISDGLLKFGEVNEIAILVLTGENKSTPIHIDHNFGLNKGVKARLNIPILNCESSFTCFYDLTPEQFNKLKLSPPRKIEHNYKPGDETKSWIFAEEDNVKPITKIELVQPTILKTSHPHNVIMTGNKFPRISMTISFKEDLIQYLE